MPRGAPPASVLRRAPRRGRHPAPRSEGEEAQHRGVGFLISSPSLSPPPPPPFMCPLRVCPATMCRTLQLRSGESRDLLRLLLRLPNRPPPQGPAGRHMTFQMRQSQKRRRQSSLLHTPDKVNFTRQIELQTKLDFKARRGSKTLPLAPPPPATKAEAMPPIVAAHAAFTLRSESCSFWGGVVARCRRRRATAPTPLLSSP